MPPPKKPPLGGSVSAPPPAPAAPATSREPGPGSELGPRKLIRPSLAEIRRDQGFTAGPSSRKMVPPEQTNAEAYYYLKQMQGRTPMVVRLLDGEELRGWIEWYDKDVIKLNRDNAPNLLVPKHAIKYLFKEEEERQHRRRQKRQERLAAAEAAPTPGEQR